MSAKAAEVYARRQRLGEEAIGFAHQVKIEALGRLGEILGPMPKATGGEHGGKRRLDGSRLEPSNPTYTDLRLDRKTAMVASNSRRCSSRHSRGASALTLPRQVRRQPGSGRLVHCESPYVHSPNALFKPA
jgi:hypothetical protein